MCQRRMVCARGGRGRATRRGSLATTSGGPARVERLCGGGRVAEVIMATGYGALTGISRCIGVPQRPCSCRTSVLSAGRVGVGDARRRGEGGARGWGGG